MQERLPNPSGTDEPDEDLDASKAPLMDHLIELRQRLIYAVIAFLVMFALCFGFARHIYQILVWPYVWVSGTDDVRLIATDFLEEIFTYLAQRFSRFPWSRLKFISSPLPDSIKTSGRRFCLIS
jgi:sec-independent protein translocase protein TatC